MGHNSLFRAILFVTFCAILTNPGCQGPNSTTSARKTSKSQVPASEIKFEETSLDLGKVGPGAKLEKEVKFTNSGQGILIVTDIIRCCGLSAEVDKEQYEPGETGILKVHFQAQGEIGPFNKELKVHSNDPVSPIVIIKINSEIIQKVFWEPEKINLFLDEENAACPQLTIKCIDEQEFAITGFRSTGNCITAKYNPTIKETEHVLDLKVDMEKLAENMNGQIKVLMNHPEGDIASILFEVLPKYKIKPGLITLKNLKENEPRRETIQILCNYNNKDFEIESTSSEKNTVKMVDYKKIDNGYEMNIEIIPQLQQNDESRVIDNFYINIKGEEPLVLECYEYY